MSKRINVGIDLGEFNSVVAVYDETCDQVKVLKNDFEKEITPTVVCIENGEVLIGEEAKNEIDYGNINAVTNFKLFMPEKYPFDDSVSFYLDGDEYTPEHLTAIFLRELKNIIEREHFVEIDWAVITVPTYFTEEQIKATMRAGRAAGLTVMAIISEPIAAIIEAGLVKWGSEEKTVLVYDLGEGKFDVTLAKVKGAKIDIFAVNGNHFLGGHHWTKEIIKEIAERFADEYGIDLTDYPEEMKKLRRTAEDVKKRLTKTHSTFASVCCEGIDAKFEITRERFEERTAELLNVTATLVSQCFDDIGDGFGWHSVDEVVFVGGSTRMPQVYEYIMKEFGKPPINLNTNVETVVAAGAARYIHRKIQSYFY